VRRMRTASLVKWRNRRGNFLGGWRGRGTCGGVGGLLITSPNEMRLSNEETPKRKEICYLEDKKEKEKEEKKQVANVHAHISQIRFLYIRLFIFLPRCFGSIRRSWKGNLERSMREAMDVILRGAAGRKNRVEVGGEEEDMDQPPRM